MPNEATITDPISVHELKRCLQDGTAVVVDVREYPEYAAAHIPGTLLRPLSELRGNPCVTGADGCAVTGPVLLLCRSGRHAEAAAASLRAAGVPSRVVAGGLDAWQHAGYPVERNRGPMALERQVRIAAGSLVLLGLLVRGLGFVPYFIGAGLVFAGVTDTCGLGLLLAKMPWNRQPHGAVYCPGL